MTYRETVEVLGQAGIPDAEFEASVLFSDVGGVSRETLLCDPGTECRSDAFLAALARRLKREPLQYILGKWYFRGLEFTLGESTLCPRPDTETLVEEAVKIIPEGALFCDVGTGSGCIAVAVLHERPDLRCVAVDILPDALRIASGNAEMNGVAGRFTPVVCDARDEQALSALGVFGAVLSNPPYIPSGEIASLDPELSYEPRAALDGGEDGYDFYRTIIPGTRLEPGGVMIFETGAGMAAGLCGIGKSFGFDCRIRRDLSGIERVVIMKKTENDRVD